MNLNNILYYVVLIIAFLVLSFIAFYFYLKDKIHEEAARNEIAIDQYKISGEEKMEIVVQCLIEYVPFLLRFLFNPTKLEVSAQETYDALKYFWLQRVNKEANE